MNFEKIDYKELSINPMQLISDEWWLVSAGSKESGFNTMTASWGHLGSIWGKHMGMPSAVVYLRPQRYTKEFIDREEYFTLSILQEGNRQALAYAGAHSGRDEDKIKNAGLHPVFIENQPTFDEAKLVFICRKLYHGSINEAGFVDTSIIDKHYPERDFHEMYIAEIVSVYKHL